MIKLEADIAKQLEQARSDTVQITGLSSFSRGGCAIATAKLRNRILGLVLFHNCCNERGETLPETLTETHICGLLHAILLTN